MIQKENNSTISLGMILVITKYQQDIILHYKKEKMVSNDFNTVIDDQNLEQINNVITKSLNNWDLDNISNIEDVFSHTRECIMKFIIYSTVNKTLKYTAIKFMDDNNLELDDN